MRVVDVNLNPLPFPLKAFILLPTMFLTFWLFNIFVFLTSVYNLFLELNFVLWSDGFHPIFANLTFTLGTLTGYLLNCRPNWFIMKPFLCNWKIHKSLILNNLKKHLFTQFRQFANNTRYKIFNLVYLIEISVFCSEQNVLCWLFRQVNVSLCGRNLFNELLTAKV